MTDSPNVARAKALLTAALQQRNERKPGSLVMVTLAAISDAEQKVSQAEAELRNYQSSTENMIENKHRNGTSDIDVDPLRAEKLENLRATVARRYGELAAIKRRWLAGSLEN